MEQTTRLREMIFIASPQPDSLIPISARPTRDDLKELLLTCGFDFLVPELESIRKELDPEGKGTVHLDRISDYLNGKLAACLDDRALTEAFELFDSDKDGKINLEEFEFFMNSFAKDMNSLRGNKIVQEMMQQSARYADKKTKLFEISKLVEVLRGTWQV